MLGFEYGYSPGRARRAGDLGGAVRRLRQRRAGDHRPVHRLGRGASGCACRGLVMLLPHGYEGQGPEHSLGAARALPAALRRGQHAGRQLHDAGQLLPRAAPADAPQVPQAADRDDAEVAAAPQACGLAARRLRPGHPLPAACCRRPRRWSPDDKVRRVVLCSGKVYYDLLQERASAASTTSPSPASSSSIPWPRLRVIEQCSRYANAEVVWCQEEPANMGAWTFVSPRLDQHPGGAEARSAALPAYVGRAAAASPATGLLKIAPGRSRPSWSERALVEPLDALPQPFRRVVALTKRLGEQRDIRRGQR